MSRAGAAKKLPVEPVTEPPQQPEIVQAYEAMLREQRVQQLHAVCAWKIRRALPPGEVIGGNLALAYMNRIGAEMAARTSQIVVPR